MSQEPSYNTRKICRIFASGGTCRFGNSCRFYHQTATDHEDAAVTEHSDPGRTKSRAPIICRAYVETKFCKFGVRCRYFHPIISHKSDSNTDDQNSKNGGLKAKKVFKRSAEEGDVQEAAHDDGYYHLPLPTRGGQQAGRPYKPRRNDKHNLKTQPITSNRSHNVPYRRLASQPGNTSEKSHEVGEDVLQDAANKSGEDGLQDAGNESAECQPVSSTTSEGNNVEKSGIQAKHQRSKRKRLCKFFKVGRCYNGDSCRFWHPNHDAKLQSAPTESTNYANQKVIFQNPAQVVLKDLSEDDRTKIYKSETNQLQRRYPKAVRTNCEDGRCMYQFTFVPSDPDWPYDVKNVVLKVSFPGVYPLKPMCVTVIEEQNMPGNVIGSIQAAISEWIEARFSDIAAIGKVELMFCSFIKWLDRHLEEVMTEALKDYRRELMAAAAGVQFIPATTLRQQYATVTNSEDDKQSPSADDESEDSEEEDKFSGECPPQPGHVGELPPESGRDSQSVSTDRKGTEVKLRELQLMENATTLIMKKVKVIVLCSRCKNKSDVTMSSQRPVQLACAKCSQDMIVAFRATMAHQFSSIIGYMDVSNCQVFDFVMHDCVFDVGCFNCNKEATIEGLNTGQPKELFCRHCHKKIKICTQSVRLQQLQPSDVIDMDGLVVEEVKKKRKIPKDPAIQEGRPLPDEGTCKHFKKSYRWLRFPCCGKVYPCDICHEEQEGGDHEMIFANRMICGFCCKEQFYSSEKPCVMCGYNLVKKGSSHWEGGRGCRDRVKMSRDDKKKYSNMGKTLSKKSQAKLPEKKTTKLRHA